MADKCDDNRFLAFVLEENDGDVAEAQRTSFYSSIRNAAILLKLHGLFAFENVRSYDGRSLSFKWRSLGVLWGYGLYAASSIVLYRLAFGDRMKNLVFYQYVVRVWLFYICYSINNMKFLNVLAELEEINDKLRNTSGIRERTASESREQRTNWMVFTFSVILASVNSSVETYVSILYLLTASRINAFYRRLHERLKKCLGNCRSTTVSSELEFLRILHTDLSDVCDKLHDWFGLSFICIFSVLIVRTLLIFYKITISTGKVSVINDVSSLTQIFGYLYVLTSTSQKLANSLRLMILQTTALPVNTYALGFFNTTRSLIPSILGVIAVYITVIIQLGTPFDIFHRFVDHSPSHMPDEEIN